MKKYVSKILYFFFFTSTVSYAVETEQTEVEKLQVENVTKQRIYSFDTRSLFGSAQYDSDIINVAISNAVRTGLHSLNTSINGRSIGEQVLDFQHLDSSQNAVLCIDEKLLKKLDLKDSVIESLPKKDCLTIKQLSPDAYYDLDNSNLSLQISIPLILLNHRPRGYIPPEQFDKGISSAFIAYQYSHYASFDQESENTSSSYLNLNGGTNIAGWNFRHTGYFDSENNKLEKYHSSMNTISTDLLSMKSRLTLGDLNTQSYMNQSATIRGVQLASDISMLPNSLRSYTPVIRGMANTNALVSVFQNGNKIFERSVPAGMFEITDLVALSSNGDLKVQVTENGGEKSSFMVPLQGNVNLIRVGQFNYSTSLGQYRLSQTESDEYIGQLSFQYGLSNYLTLSAGSNYSEPYQNYSFGTGINTFIGALKLESDFSFASPFESTVKGQQYRLSYQYNYIPLNSYLSLNSTYQSKTFSTLSEVFSKLNYESLSQPEIDYFNDYYKLKNQFNISLSKRFEERKYGSFYFSAARNEYWNKENNYDQFNFSYSNFWKKLNYSLSVSQNSSSSAHKKDEMRWNATLNIPLDIKNKKVYVNSTLQKANTHGNPLNSFIGLSGSSGENNQFGYAVSANNSIVDEKSSSSITGNLNYNLSPVSLSLNATFIDSQNQQMGLNLNGGIVAHPYGLTLTNQLSDTFAIVHAKGAKGAYVQNNRGVKIDRFGNAIYSSLAAYDVNTVGLDTNHLPLDIQLNSNQTEVVPRRYSSTLVRFDTERSSKIILKVKFEDSRQVPIGMQVKDNENIIIGMYGQSNQIFIEDDKAFSKPIMIFWGSDNNYSCNVDLSKKIANIQKSKEIFNIVDVKCE